MSKAEFLSRLTGLIMDIDYCGYEFLSEEEVIRISDKLNEALDMLHK